MRTDEQQNPESSLVKKASHKESLGNCRSPVPICSPPQADENGAAIMPCEVADERQQTLDLGDGPAPAPERKPRVRLCPRCGRGPMTGEKCWWCGWWGTGSRAATPEVGGRDPA